MTRSSGRPGALLFLDSAVAEARCDKALAAYSDLDDTLRFTSEDQARS